MSTTYANTINGYAIYAERSVQDKDGNQIDTTYAKIASLAAVATSGDYGDLLNTPTIPAAQVQSDWTEADSNDPSYIQNKPTLAAVATSGDYSDLSNTPSIPSGADLVPPYDPSTDNGKVLTVGMSTAYWALPGNAPVTDVTVDGTSVVNGQGVAQITTPTVDQSYNASSTNAQAGVAVAGAISNIRQVPSTTSSDNGKVLGVVDSSGTLGWVAGGSQQVQSDWTETNTSDPSYIQNKPATDTLVGGSNIAINTANNTVTISATGLQPALPSKTGNAGKVLAVNSNADDVVWVAQQDTTYTGSGGIAISANHRITADVDNSTIVVSNGHLAVSTSTIQSKLTGITDVQVVNSLPASPVSTVMYCLPEA